MNIFLPYEDDVIASVQALDDKRLIKQISECYQLLYNAIAERAGYEVKGYKNHPIYVHYKDSIGFLIFYGGICCYEYRWRFGKEHKYHYVFGSRLILKDHPQRDELLDPKFVPFYMEGSKGQPNYIRTTENVSELFQRKLIKKWQNDKRPPKWTNCEMPEFYKKFLEGETQ